MSKHLKTEKPTENQIVLVKAKPLPYSEQPEFAVCKFMAGDFCTYDVEHGWVVDFQCQNVVEWRDIDA
jgi:hypothetical protein